MMVDLIQKDYFAESVLEFDSQPILVESRVFRVCVVGRLFDVPNKLDDCAKGKVFEVVVGAIKETDIELI